ncbi:MAG: hypothetical protein RL650_1409 [Pseudomonadota bacterium]
MDEIQTPQMTLGLLLLLGAVLYAAWYEYKKRNLHDAKLLLAAGLLSLSGSAVALLVL